MRTAVAGVGELPQGHSSLPSTMALHAELARLALQDAGMELAEVDAVLTVSPRSDPYLIHAAALAEYLAITPAVAWTLEAGGAAPVAMVDIAGGLIAAGRAETVLIVAADQPLSDVSREAYISTLAAAGPVHPDIERIYGPTVPAMFATVARAHMECFSLSQAHLAAVAVQNRHAASLHPNAHYRAPIDAATHGTSKMIADPLRLLDCAPVSDGGGAIVVTAAGRAGARGVDMRAAGFTTRHMHLSAASSLTHFGAAAALDQALAIAGRQRNELDLALIYDCFTIAMLVNLEDLGLAAYGQSGPAFVAGEFSSQGRLPVNPHGGLLSHGHPARAGGMGQLIEAVVQLRGEAGPRQVADAQLALVHGGVCQRRCPFSSGYML